MKTSRVRGLLAIAILVGACEGPRGPQGQPGEPGAPGDAGAQGPAGPPASPAQTTGTVSGTVTNAAGVPLEGAAITTAPGDATATSAADGRFTLSTVPIGSYSLTARKSGFNDYTLPNVGVAAGRTTNVVLALTTSGTAPGTISGTVLNPNETGIPGITVAVQGGSATATTDSNGAFTLTGVSPGPVYLSATPATIQTYLPGETRSAVFVPPAGTVTDVTIHLTGRPAESSEVVGTNTEVTGCKTCHPSFATSLAGSAHGRALTLGRSHVVATSNSAIWPAVGGTVNSGITALSPVDETSLVPVYMCQNTAGAYAMKFAGTADCTVADGTLIPVAGTFGGEGDGGVGYGGTGGKNLGVSKQQFLARLADVPAAASWLYDAGKESDFLILPVQVTQSGTGGPRLAAHKATGADGWVKRSQTFSKQYAGRHNQGLEVRFNPAGEVTWYTYKELNMGCEHCHGPGSDHVYAPVAEKKLRILFPQYLTAQAEREMCGQCHAGRGAGAAPNGWTAYAWNQDNHGAFLAGAYALDDFLPNYNVPAGQGGQFDAWPDGLHGKGQGQQLTMVEHSVHGNNPYEKLTCSDCHSAHSGKQGPYRKTQTERVTASDGTTSTVTWDYYGLLFDNNALCLSCHATHGPFATVTKEHVAALQKAAGKRVDKNGQAATFTAAQTAAANAAIAAAVGEHMQEKVQMGVAAYQPTNDANPVGRCASCHMPKVGKSGGYATGPDQTGASAIAEGDQASHVFDVIWPHQSGALRKASGGTDEDIMPNSCGACHAGARVSGD